MRSLWRVFWLANIAAVLVLTTANGVSAGSEEDLRSEVEALRRRVAELEARLPQGGSESTFREISPGALRLSREEVEAELYGFLTSETVWENAGTGGDRFLNIIPFNDGRKDDDDFFLSVNATRLGLRLRSSALEDRLGTSAHGRLEVDFDSTDGGPRIRHAYAELLHPRFNLLFGQTWAVAAQLNPDTINSDNLFNLGNVYERVPQLRVWRDFEAAGGRLRLEGAVLRFFGEFDQEPLALQQPPGPPDWEIRSSSLPLGQMRVAWRSSRENAYGALSLSAGRLKVEETSTSRRQTVKHLLAAAELVLPSWGPFTLSGEAFWGRAGAFNGGVGQAVVISSTGEARSVESRGGFVQLAYRLSESLRCHLIYGIDDPENREAGLDTAIERNQIGLANCFWRVLPALDLALEVQSVKTEWQLPQRFDADDLRVTQAVYLNF
jgi:hypothetical protein